jgi:hypothetical protein
MAAENTSMNPLFDQTSSDNNALEKQDHDIEDAAQAEISPREIHGWKWAFTSATLLSSIFLYALDCTVVADIQAQMVDDFDSIDKFLWLSTGLLMPATTVVMPWGRIYSQFNANALYLLSVLFFEVGSALCGAAPNINAMIVGRAIVGAGGAGIYMGSHDSHCGHNYPKGAACVCRPHRPHMWNWYCA